MSPIVWKGPPETHHDHTHSNLYFLFFLLKARINSAPAYATCSLRRVGFYLSYTLSWGTWTEHTCFVLLGLNKPRSLNHPSFLLCFSITTIFSAFLWTSSHLPISTLCQRTQANHTSAVLQDVGKEEAITLARLHTIFLQCCFKIKLNSTHLLKVTFQIQALAWITPLCQMLQLKKTARVWGHMINTVQNRPTGSPYWKLI